MAESEIIKSSDVIQEGIFQPTIKESELLVDSLDKLIEGFGKLHAESTSFLKGTKKLDTSKEINAVTEALDKSAKARKKIIDLEVIEEKEKAKLIKLQENEAKALERQTKAKEKEAKAQETANRSYVIASKRLAEMRDRYRDLVISGQGGAESTKELRIEIQNLDAKLKSVDASVGVFNRHVGDYKNQVGIAIEQSGLFGNTIGKIRQFVEATEAITGLYTATLATNTATTEANTVSHGANATAIKTEEAATQKLSLAKRALNAIASPAGALLAIGAAIAGVLVYLSKINQEFKDFFNLLGAKTQDIFATGNEFQKLEIMMQKFRKEVIALKEALQVLNDNEEDFTRQSQDATLALGVRRDLEKKAAEARLIASKAGIKIAQKELDIANQNIKAEESRFGNKAGTASIEFYEKRSEAVQKVFEAQDKLDTSVETNAKRNRELKDEAIINELELIRSKKLGADSQVETLKKQVADEKALIEDREASLILQRQAQDKALTEEISLLEKFGLKKAEIENLINEKDSVNLERKLKALTATRLNEAEQLELAKVVLEAQKNELDRNEANAKIIEKIKQNKERVLALGIETAQIEKEQAAFGLSAKLSESQLRENDYKAKALSQEFLFNRKKGQMAKQSITDTLAGEKALYEKQLEIINAASAAKRTALENDLSLEEEIRNAEIKKLVAETSIKQVQALQAFNAKEAASKLASADFDLKLDLARTTQQLNNMAKVTSALENELEARSNLQQQAYDRDISNREKAVSKQQALADRGLDNDLARQEAMLQKQQLAKQEAQEKEARQKEVLDMVQQYNAFLIARLNQPYANPNTAPARALSDVLLSKGIAKGLVQFAADGNNMIEGAGTETSDSIPFMLSKNEAVIKASENMKNNDAVKALNSGTFKDNYMPKFELEKVKSSAIGTQTNSFANILIKSNAEIKSLLTEIKNKPIQQVDVDGVGRLIETVHMNGIKSITKHQTKARL
jgi:hypothetical protein